MFKSFRLLTKTTLFYLIFVLLAFFISAKYITNKADQYVNEETDFFFQKRERHLTKYLEESDSIKNFRTTKFKGVVDKNDTLNYPQFKDTLIFIDELGEYQLHRQKTLIVKARGQHFLVEMLINIDDFLKLKTDVSRRIIPFFLILALVIILFNGFMSGYLLKPFNRILEQMNNYKVGKGVKIKAVKTSTSEFKKLQLLFKHMVNRTEDDYQKLKEYTENMAHEIQTPLAIIRNKTEILISDEKVMKEHKESVKVIYDEANHLSRLGTTLNLLTKIENGEYKNTINLKSYDIIQKHLESVKELIALKSLKVEVNLKKEHELLIDPFLFDILLKNILRNAIRYASNKGPIKIETTDKSLKISNYGEPLDVASNIIFDRFYTSSSSGQSLGLGLSLVKRICDLNRMKIDYSYIKGQHTFIIEPFV
ncbi:MAG: HAMP domain-containing histidine kinase [Bacteroidales bacterium]|nr:HAMP domain-containing histidine kinase [Bacteroidales bacterium]